ncbi:hypothetical protein BH11MYX2_BH11MYX2_37730 [soil metagenome]
MAPVREPDSRDRGTGGLIGPFINTIVVRTDLDAVDDFATALHRVRDALIEGIEHKDVPLEHVVRALRTSRGSAVGLNVMFSMPPSRPLPSLPELVFEPITSPPSHTEFDLELLFSGQNLDGRLVYDVDVFDRATIERLARHFQELLAQVIADPTRSLATIDLLEPEERAQIESWNRTARAEEEPKTIHERVALQSPDSIAIVCKNIEIAYRAIAERTDRVAGWLASRGVSRRDKVAVSVDRSVDMVAAILAVLRVGAAYVPIDPAYPAARRDFIRTNAGAVVELTDATLREALACPASAPMVDVTGDDLAYVLYTSGSTGTPKGVGIPHRAVTNFLASMQRAPGIAATDTLLAVTTLSFDIAGLELYLPLTTGAKVVIASNEQAHDGEQLAALITASGATIVSHLIYRHVHGLEHSLGLFANPLIMRVSTAGSPSFRELIARTHEAVTGAFENGECDVLSLAPTNLFRLWFNFLYVAPGSETQELELPPELTAMPGELPSGERRIAYDVIMFVRNTGDDIKIMIAYNKELFSDAGANALLAGYAERLRALCR